MKVTMYELLGMIKDGKAPKKIKWEDAIFAYSECDKDYLEFPFSEEEYKGLFCMKDSILTQYLNDEVEILDYEEKGLPEKITMCTSGIMGFDAVENITTELKDKINSIIDYLEKQSKGE